MSDESRYLTTKAAAELLELTPDYLYRLRAARMGPPYRMHGRKIRYLRADVLDWDRASVVPSAPATAAE